MNLNLGAIFDAKFLERLVTFTPRFAKEESLHDSVSKEQGA